MTQRSSALWSLLLMTPLVLLGCESKADCGAGTHDEDGTCVGDEIADDTGTDDTGGSSVTDSDGDMATSSTSVPRWCSLGCLWCE